MTAGRLFQAGGYIQSKSMVRLLFNIWNKCLSSGYTQSKSRVRLLFNIWNKCLSSGYTQSKSMVRLQEPPIGAPSEFSPEMVANLAQVRGEPCVPLFRTFAFRRDGTTLIFVTV